MHLEDLDPSKNRIQRRAEFMRQRRKEFIFESSDTLRCLPRRPLAIEESIALLLKAFLLGDVLGDAAAVFDLTAIVWNRKAAPAYPRD